VFLAFLDGRVPLPNLRKLTSSTSAPVAGDDLIALFNIFICPSMTELRTVMPNQGLPRRDYSRVISPSVPAFLQKLKDTCPHIEVLEFYTDGPVSFDQRNYDRYSPTTQCRGILSSFSSLRSFSSTTYILEFNVLSILGQLPRLESLGIRGGSTEHPVVDKGLSMPEDWFPALKVLRLYDVVFEDIWILWKQATVNSKVVSLLLQIDYCDRQRNLGDFSLVGNWVGPFLEGLLDVSPQLQCVQIYLGSEDKRSKIPQNEWDIFEIDNDLFEIFRYHLSLQNRYISPFPWVDTHSSVDLTT
jgi:hypothetical protein